MSRAMLILANPQVRSKAKEWISNAPVGTRVEFKEEKRSTEQNDKMWAMLSDIASQKLHHGRKLKPAIWKILFMDALGREVEWIPALEGEQAIPIGHSSSDLSKAEMSDLIEVITEWGIRNGVEFHDSPSLNAAGA